MTAPLRVWTLDAASVEEMRPRLSDILIDCVQHGASIGFLAPLDPADADAFWRRVEHAAAQRRCHVLVAAPPTADVAGTVVLDVDTPPNQPHRATVSKLLVHSASRRRGIGEALMAGVERVAADIGRRLRTLDTATAEAARLYQRLGWTVAGVIPDYALNPDRTLTATSCTGKSFAFQLERARSELLRPLGRDEKRAAFRQPAAPTVVRAAGRRLPLRARQPGEGGVRSSPGMVV